MAKSSNEVDFLAALKSRKDAAAPGTGDKSKPAPHMVLHTPPTGKSKSLDQLLETDDAASPAPAAPPVESRETAAASQGGDFGFMLPMARLKHHPWNARIYRSPERVRELATSMAATRQNHPISVVPDPSDPGSFFIVDGETRFKAAELLNWRELWALEDNVDARSAIDIYVASFKHTEDTQPISQMDMGVRWSQLVAEKLADQDQLAERLGISQSTVSKMMSYSKFPTKVLDYMRENQERFPYSIAGALATAIATRTEDELFTLCQRVVSEEISRRAIGALLKEKSPGPRGPRRAAVVSRPIRLGQSQVGMLRTYESGAVEFKVAEGSTIDAQVLSDLVDVLDAAAELVGSGHVNLREALIEKLKAGHKSDS